MAHPGFPWNRRRGQSGERRREKRKTQKVVTVVARIIGNQVLGQDTRRW